MIGSTTNLMGRLWVRIKRQESRDRTKEWQIRQYRPIWTTIALILISWLLCRSTMLSTEIMVEPCFLGDVALKRIKNMKKSELGTSILLLFCLMGCNGQTHPIQDYGKKDLKQEQTTNDMKSFVSLFEIPATDISRAVNFYRAILDIEIEQMQIPGMEMGVFPYEDQMVTGVIIKGEGYQPSPKGVTLYLNGGDNLQPILDKVEENGGIIMMPKTAHADGNGFFALFQDTEGNKLGLNSPN